MDLLIQQFNEFAQFCRDNGMGDNQDFENECRRMIHCLKLKEQEIDRLVEIVSDCREKPDLLQFRKVDYNR